jgi:hypothetical protein
MGERSLRFVPQGNGMVHAVCRDDTLAELRNAGMGWEIYYIDPGPVAMREYVGKEPDLHSAKLATYNWLRKRISGIKRFPGKEPWKFNRAAMAARKAEKGRADG